MLAPSGRTPAAIRAVARSLFGGAERKYQTSPPARIAAPAPVPMVEARATDRPDSSSFGSQKWLSPHALCRFLMAMYPSPSPTPTVTTPAPVTISGASRERRAGVGDGPDGVSAAGGVAPAASPEVPGNFLSAIVSFLSSFSASSKLSTDML